MVDLFNQRSETILRRSTLQANGSGSGIHESDDIVPSIWKHIAVHKRTCKAVACFIEDIVCFGMSAKTYRQYAYQNFGIKLTEEEAQAIHTKYFKMYPNVGKYHKYVWNNYKKPGFFVYTALGRKVKPKLGTDGINAPIQGSGAETTKLAVHYLIRDNPNEPVLDYIYNVVHDAIYLRIPMEDKKKWHDLLEVAMLKAWDEIKKSSIFKIRTCTMVVD